jgi:hypothetical protein
MSVPYYLLYSMAPDDVADFLDGMAGKPEDVAAMCDFFLPTTYLSVSTPPIQRLW